MTGLDVTYFGAFIGGLLSFVTPCVLPLVPPYLCFLGGVTFEQLSASDTANRAVVRRVFLGALLFVLGFATVFVAMGLTASAIGQAIARYFGVLSIVAGALIIVFGLHLLGVFRIGLLFREARIHVGGRSASLGLAFLVGMAFAFGWSPCVGPILAPVLALAGAKDTMAEGGALLGAYALGMGLPFLAAAGAAPWFLRLMKRFRPLMRHVERVLGVLLIATGILFVTGAFRDLGAWLYENFPWLQLS
ncbi:MAG: cytochrome c biogenesis protein CcdA [Rhodospirillaceae bacterium]|nr:cytochrome c biogenesis protein CcdA [Rhodospirillaceae bacterium]